MRNFGVDVTIVEFLDRMVPTEDEDISKELFKPVSYTHLRAHETVLDLVCRLLLEKKKYKRPNALVEQQVHQTSRVFCTMSGRG